jgi:hypothetical protein
MHIGELISFYVVIGLLMNFVAHGNKRCGFSPWIVILWPITVIMLVVSMIALFPSGMRNTFVSPKHYE